MTKKSIDNYLKLEPKDFIPIYGFARVAIKHQKEEPEWKTIKELNRASWKSVYTSAIMGAYHIALPTVLIIEYGDNVINYLKNYILKLF